MQQSARAGANVFGREAELDLIERFVAAQDARIALVLTGAPGAGKTTLWEEGCVVARRHGLRVLSARPSDAETGLSYGGLVDLLREIDTSKLDVPAPQLRALEVALLRAEPEDSPPREFAISAGLLNALRSLAERGPMLIAVDDLPWLDRPSADALVYAARRLRGLPIRFLLARRPADPHGLEQAIEPFGLDRLTVGPLSLGATRALISGRLGLSLSRRVLRQVHETGQGNPLFTLELGRSLVEHGLPAIGEELPIPDAVEDLLGTRLVRLTPSVRRLLLAVALNADLRPAQLAALADVDALDEAVQAGVLVVDGERVRASHPLLAAAASKHTRARERRELHHALACVVADDELRARHLALATDAPDEQLAATVAAAAHTASTRGAWHGASELGEHALRLTPPDDPERPKRAFDVGMALAIAGERQRLARLLAAELESLPAGPARARLLLLMPGVVQDNDEIRRYFEQALEESRSDPALHAAVLGNLSFNATAVRYEQVEAAERWAEEALPPSRADPEIERSVLYALAYARSLRGKPFDDIRRRFRAISGARSYILASPERIAALRLVWRGEVNRAREAFADLLALAEGGDVQGYAHVRLHLCDLELRAGAWERAMQLLDEWADPVERETMAWPAFERCQAHLAAGFGLVSETKRWAAEELARAQAVSVPSHELEAHALLGLAELLDHEPARAAENLAAVWEHTEREGIEEPGVFPVAPDLVEALVELGDVEEARTVTHRLRGLSERQGHPWGLATAKRCEALVQLALGYDEDAVEVLNRAAVEYGALGLRFDAARSMLLVGRALRRHRKWGAARRALEQAASTFDEIGSPGWAEQARAELARVSARKPKSEGALTPTEERAATLAAEGLSNKEIAAILFVTVHTVEVHLSHVYAKLGVHSRGQLARRLTSV